MIADPLEEAIYRALTDSRLFSVQTELIDRENWARFKRAVSEQATETAMEIVEAAARGLEKRIRQEKDPKRRENLEQSKPLLDGLKSRLGKSPCAMPPALDRLDRFGPMRCQLLNTEDLGKVIENYPRSTVEQFFLYKIQKEGRSRQALTALHEIVQCLYAQQVEPLRIAFFVRKINSLAQIMEVLK